MKKPIFIDNQHQDEFDENGFVKITNFSLTTDDIQILFDFYDNSGIKKYSEEAVYMAMDNPDKQLISHMYKTIETIVMSHLNKILVNPMFFYGSFISKYPNSKVTVLPHQDGTFVDNENEQYSLTCWIPLVDVDIENGCMGVIKNSNKIYDSIRPLPSPQVYRPLNKHVFSIMPYFKLIPMKAGEILFFDNKTFHNSPPNLTDKPRLAISSWITQENTPLRLYYLKPGTNNKLLKYAIDKNFYLKYDNLILSKMYSENKLIEDYNCIEEVDYVYKDFSKRKMNNEIEKLGNLPNQDFKTHMNKFFPNEMNTSVWDKLKIKLIKLF